MPWPLSQDYNEAIQSPATNFTDPDLKKGEVVANALGLPIPCSGNFADVYQMRCPDGSRWAVKCFTREVPGLRERYQLISAHLKQAKLPFTVDFSYLDQGIRMAGKWYPILKMQWVEGLTLNQFVSKHLDKPAKLETLAQIWARMGQYLRAAEVGHCDLQHGNVLLVPGAHSLALKLIDYDGMWVPALAKTKTGEVGHANYQHPRRLREATFSLEVDRFPLLLVATSLRALKAGGAALWLKYDNADNLLFKEADLREPVKSRLFYDLTKSDDPIVKVMLDHLLKALRGGLETTPLLDEVLPPDASAAIMSSRPSRLAITAVASIATPTAPVAAVAAPVAAIGSWDFVKSESGTAQPMRHGRRGATSARAKIVRSASVTAVVVLGLLGGLGVWSTSGSRQQPAPAPIDPQPAPGAILVLRIDQSGAEVSVDGDRQTVDAPGDDKPVTIPMKPGLHHIVVSKDGFKSVIQDFRLASGQHFIISKRLIPLEPPPVEQLLEGELMVCIHKSSGFQMGPQQMLQWPAYKWSNNAQLFGIPRRVGEFADLQLPVSSAGKYQLLVYVTKAPDYGVVQFSLDERPMGQPVDCFEPGTVFRTVVRTGPIDLGTADLKKGNAVLRIEVTGTNVHSVGARYMFGLDCVRLKPVLVAPKPGVAATDGAERTE